MIYKIVLAYEALFMITVILGIYDSIWFV